MAEPSSPTLAQKALQALKSTGAALLRFARFCMPKKKPPVPKEILADNRIRHAFWRQRWGRRFKRLAFGMAVSGGISTATVIYPDTVSSPFDDFMKNKGYSTQLSDHFHVTNVRVYDKNAFLKPFQQAGLVTLPAWKRVMEKPTFLTVAAQTAATAINYPYNLLTNAFAQATGKTPDAYAFIPRLQQSPALREVYIQPPPEWTVSDFIATFTGIKIDTPKTVNDTQELQKALFEFVMLHEARHGEQDYGFALSVMEADADLYALKALKNGGTDQAIVNEIATLVLHARTLASLSGKVSHPSSVALTMGVQSPLITHQVAGAFWQLNNIMKDLDHYNKGSFAPETPEVLRHAVMASGMSQAGFFKHNTQLNEAASMSNQALGYFNDLSGGKLLHNNFLRGSLNLMLMSHPYAPVQEKPPVVKQADSTQKPLKKPA
jgi:hypothetical protein